MAVPNHLASSHQYSYNSAMNTLTAVIAAIIAQCTGGNPAWTNPGAGNTIVSPVDTYGRYYQVAFTVTSAYQLTIAVTDQYGVTIDTRQIQPNNSGSVMTATDVVICSGQYHLWIEFERSTPENFRSGILDTTPQTPSAWNTSVYCYAYRNSSGVAQASDSGYMSISGVTSNTYLLMAVQSISGINAPLTPVGDSMFYPIFMNSTANQTSARWIGRIYQVLAGPATLSPGSMIQVPIDSGVQATFRVVGCALYSGGFFEYMRILVRAD